MISFQTLWDNHPSPSNNEPCKNEKGLSNFENQCAIRMGVALLKSGVSLVGTRKCWYAKHEGHVLAAEELGRWIDDRPKLFGKKRAIRDKAKVLSEVTGKKGIVLCLNFWGHNNSGDHIDVWNGSQMKHGNSSWFALSEEVWFWEMS